MLRWIAAAALLMAAMPATASEWMIVIAHRGSSGELPEHTLAAYARAIEQGADYIEPDLVMTRDGVLVARHENEISGTTDVAAHPEFAARRTTRTIDGVPVSGWFTEDFTLAELKTLRARERLPQLRPASAKHDGEFAIPTFREILDLVAKAKRRVGLYPEIKHGSYFASAGLAIEPVLIALLAGYGYADATDPVFIQSFEVGNLQALRKVTKLRLVQLIGDSGGPADRLNLSYRSMITPEGLKTVAAYADAVGVAKALMVPRGADGRSATPTGPVAHAHAAGLKVHAWTFRPENYFLPGELRRGSDPAGHGDMAAEVRAFAALGVDGVFSDFPGLAVAAMRSNAAPE